MLTLDNGPIGLLALKLSSMKVGKDTAGQTLITGAPCGLVTILLVRYLLRIDVSVLDFTKKGRY